jgi:NADP-dependent 3-hydroxy acid dehydrogenase YdfG
MTDKEVWLITGTGDVTYWPPGPDVVVYYRRGAVIPDPGVFVLGLTKSAALEYAPRSIRINAVCPGTIDTPMAADMQAKGELDMAEAVRNQPIGRLGTADEIAAAVLWLCSPGASFVVGVALPVDGGYTAA